MTYRYFLIIIVLCCFYSCIVQAPKYAKVEQVLMLKPGMTKEEVSNVLGIPPYDLKSVNDKGETILIYKYRVIDRKTFPLLMKPANGVKTTGKWVDLFVTYGADGKAISIESCSECEETKPTEKKIDINALITLITVTIPAVLVFIGFSQSRE